MGPKIAGTLAKAIGPVISVITSAVDLYSTVKEAKEEAADNPKKAKEKVNRSIEDSIDKKDMEELASFAANMITKRTRLGYGVSANGQEKSKLEKLKGRPSPYKSTIRARIYAEKRGELSRETTPVKS